jgi:hypothetical protein
VRLFFLFFLLQSCGTPPQLSPYEQHKEDIQNFRDVGSLEGKSRAELVGIWQMFYIEALLNNRFPNE